MIYSAIRLTRIKDKIDDLEQNIEYTNISLVK